MKELIAINRYVHDLSSAMWICGSFLMWLLDRESRRQAASPDAQRALMRLARKLRCLTLPALLITLATGGVRAATFARYEHPGEITTSTIATLVVKHVLFTFVVAWGLWVHWRSRTGPPQRADGS